MIICNSPILKFYKWSIYFSWNYYFPLIQYHITFFQSPFATFILLPLFYVFVLTTLFITLDLIYVLETPIWVLNLKKN